MRKGTEKVKSRKRSAKPKEHSTVTEISRKNKIKGRKHRIASKISRSVSAVKAINVPRTDFGIMIMTVILLVLGVLMVFSASYYSELSKGRSPYGFLIKNAGLSTVGALLMIGVSYVDYRVYKRYSKLIMLVSIGLLALVFTPFGITINNARRWINLGITIMPGEIAKVAGIIFVSAILSKKGLDVNSPKRSLLPIGIVIAIYVWMIMKQPNMSTAMTIVFIIGAITFIAGLNKIYFIGAIGIGATGAAALILSGGYRVARVMTFLDPFKDPTGESTQVVASLLALGSGGILGKGPGGSIQKALYLPEPQTDFILAIIGEELGFVGIVAMVGVFTILIWRGLRVALRAQDRFGMLMASGIVMMIGIQVLLNIAIVTSSMPATGVALPFVSYGGNATWVYCAAVGILLNIARHSKKPIAKRQYIGDDS